MSCNWDIVIFFHNFGYFARRRIYDRVAIYVYFNVSVVEEVCYYIVNLDIGMFIEGISKVGNC